MLALLHPERRNGKESSSSPFFVFSRGTREAFADALSQAAAGPARPPPPPRGFGFGFGAGGDGAGAGGEGSGFGFGGPAFFSGRTLVACGGHDDGWRPFRTTEIYDPVVDEWSPGPTAPAPLPFAAAAVRFLCFFFREREGNKISQEKKKTNLFLDPRFSFFSKL